MVFTDEKRNQHVTKIIKIITIIAVLLVNLIIFSKNSVSYAYGASSAIVIEQSTGKVFYEENADAPLPIASTTKILTALTVIDNVKELDETVIIPQNAVGIEGSSIYLVAGERLTYRELLYGLMLRSGNDCAVALAIATFGDEKCFVEMMNVKAKECGAENCNFTNPHGLHDDSHMCSARDLAKITRVALSREVFCEIVSTKIVKIAGDPIRYLQNKNKMLWNYEGGDGVKTGFTKKSGRCLVSSATRDGVKMICVVINHPDMWADSARFLDAAFLSNKTA